MQPHRRRMMKPQYLVVDTAALVTHVPLWEYGETLCSVPEVIAEIRDKEARRRVEALPFPITMRQPLPQSIKFVNEFSKKTGDYASLSLADIKILALTYELEVEVQGNADHLNKEPRKIITESAATKGSRRQRRGPEEFNDPPEEGEEQSVPEEADTDHQAVPHPEDTETTERKENDMTQDAEDKCSERSIGNDSLIHAECVEDGLEENEEDGLSENEEAGEEENVNEREEEEEDDDDDGGGWITCKNIKKHKTRKNFFGAPEEEEEEEREVKVACITGDFAVQNVLKHIGLSVMGVDGKIIKRLKTYILRCYACFKTTSVMEKIFCPHCGNKTLKKVSVTLDPDGTQRIWINTKKPINRKGMKYSLPMPKGGKHGRNPILVEDQREAKRFSSNMSKKKLNPLHEDYNPDQTPFAVRDVYSRAAQLGYIGGKNHYHFYWEKRNPNEPQRRTGKK